MYQSNAGERTSLQGRDNLAQQRRQLHSKSAMVTT
jgi:hypothetical protein